MKYVAYEESSDENDTEFLIQEYKKVSATSFFCLSELFLCRTKCKNKNTWRRKSNFKTYPKHKKIRQKKMHRLSRTQILETVSHPIIFFNPTSFIHAFRTMNFTRQVMRFLKVSNQDIIQNLTNRLLTNRDRSHKERDSLTMRGTIQKFQKLMSKFPSTLTKTKEADSNCSMASTMLAKDQRKNPRRSWEDKNWRISLAAN